MYTKGMVSGLPVKFDNMYYYNTNTMT